MKKLILVSILLGCFAFSLSEDDKNEVRNILHTEFNTDVINNKSDDNRGNSVWRANTSDSLAIGYENNVVDGADNGDNNNKLNLIFGRSNTVNGKENLVRGVRGNVVGSANHISGIGANEISGSFNHFSGTNSSLNGDNNIVFGNNNNIIGASNDNILLGHGIQGDNLQDAIAFGKDTTAKSGEVSFGSDNKKRKIFGVAGAGITEESSYVATGGEVYTVKTELETKIEEKVAKTDFEEYKESLNERFEEKLDKTKFEEELLQIEEKLNEKMDKTDANVNQIAVNLDGVRKDIASVAAMSNIPGVDYSSIFSIGAAYGNSKGNSAIAIGIGGSLPNRRLVYKGSLGLNSNSHVTFGMGVSLSLGDHKTEDSKIEKLEKENKILNDKLNELMKKFEELKTMLVK